MSPAAIQTQTDPGSSPNGSFMGLVMAPGARKAATSRSASRWKVAAKSVAVQSVSSPLSVTAPFSASSAKNPVPPTM